MLYAHGVFRALRLLLLGLPILLPLVPAAAQRGAPAAEDAPAAPALAPPPPVRLSPHPPPAAATIAPDPRAPLGSPLPGLEQRAEGGWRLRFSSARSPAPPPLTLASLGELGRRLAALPSGRIIVIAQASGPATDASVARRLSLERGIAVKQALVAGGLAETRIDIRPAGLTPEATDAVDVLPPAAPRSQPPR
jgi:hypothetical protein